MARFVDKRNITLVVMKYLRGQGFVLDQMMMLLTNGSIIISNTGMVTIRTSVDNNLRGLVDHLRDKRIVVVEK